MGVYLQKIKAWIAAHPYIAGLIAAVESALTGALISVLSDYAAGNYPLSKQGLQKMGAFILGSVIIGLRNYLKQAPRHEWTQEERALRANGGR